MTLLIGIKCTDGIVVAADGAATFATSLGAVRTIRQPVRKLSVVNDRMIVGVTGAIGLQQRFVGELSAMTLGSGARQHQVMEMLATAIRRPMKDEYGMAEALRGSLGQQALQGVVSASLIALMIQGEPTLIQFDHQGSPECATENLRFVSLGSGQPLADPFLAFLRRIFWTTSPPSLQAGIFAATWALQHAILTNPGGVDDPIQVMTMCAAPNGCQIREVEESDLGTHREAIAEAERRLATFREAIGPDASPGELLPPIPRPE